MAAIATCQTAVASYQAALTTKIEEVQMDVGLLWQDMDKIRSRLSAAENRVGQVEDAVGENTGAICSLQSRFKMLEHRAEDSENRCRRNNIRIVGLAEGKNPTVFAEELLRSLLPAAHLSPYFMVESPQTAATAWPSGLPSPHFYHVSPKF